MNNKEFINELSKQTNQSVSATTKLVNDTIRILEEHFQQNDIVTLSGFGSFEVKKKMERISVNPTTGKRYLIPPKLVLSFKQSNVLKDRFNAE
ncbi:MAG: HU family DNA-binding protein [Bacteroidaceae bacterium]|nr:HU family DNA-binding protein [Bacteroidaceae bacterium]